MKRRKSLLYLILALILILNAEYLFAYVPPPPYYPPLCNLGGCERITEPVYVNINYLLKDCPNCQIHLWYSKWKENCNGVEIDVVYPYGLWYYSHQACVVECSNGNFGFFNFKAIKEVLLHDPEFWPENGRTKMVRISKASCWYNGGTGTNDDMWLICQYAQRCCYVSYYVRNDNGIIIIEHAEVSAPAFELCPPDENNNNCTVFCNYYEPAEKISVDLNDNGEVKSNLIKIISRFDEINQMILTYSKLWNSNSINIFDIEGKIIYSGKISDDYQSQLQKNKIYLVKFDNYENRFNNFYFILEE